MKRYSDGTDIPGSDDEPDEDTNEVNPSIQQEQEQEQEPEVPAFVLEMARANEATRSAQAETNRLRAEVEALRNPPAPPIKLEEGDAFNKPEKLLDAFSKLLEAQVGPLKRDAAENQRTNTYNSLKAQIKAANPAFARIEGIVDQLMVGKDPTEANIIEAVERAVGRMALTNPSSLNSNSAPNKTEPDKMRPPPHLSTKTKVSEPGTKNEPKYDLSNFDENEKRLMREKGLTPKQFITLRDTDPNTLTTARYKEIMADKL